MLLRIDECLTVDGIDLQLMTATVDEELHELGHLLDTVRLAERAVVDLDRERSAIAHATEIGLGERTDDAERTLHGDVEGRRVVRAERMSLQATVCGGRQLVCMPDVVHRRTGPRTIDATAVVLASLEGVSPGRDEPFREFIDRGVGIAHLGRIARGGENLGTPRKVRVHQIHELIHRDELLLEDEFTHGRERVDSDGNARSVDAKVVVLCPLADVTGLFDAASGDHRDEWPREDLDVLVLFLEKVALVDDLSLHL